MQNLVSRETLADVALGGYAWEMEKHSGGRPPRMTCRDCEMHVALVGPLSKRKLCIHCAEKRMSMSCRLAKAGVSQKEIHDLLALNSTL